MKFFNFFGSYLDNLTPDRADMLLLWTISTFFVWYWMVRYRNKIVEGQTTEGANLGKPAWETREIVVFFSLMMFVPTCFYLLYLTQYKLYGAGAIVFIIWYQVFGRFIFDWILAFRSGKSEVPIPPSETKIITETETKIVTN